jgi:hypothetical protein
MGFFLHRPEFFYGVHFHIGEKVLILLVAFAKEIQIKNTIDQKSLDKNQWFFLLTRIGEGPRTRVALSYQLLFTQHQSHSLKWRQLVAKGNR